MSTSPEAARFPWALRTENCLVRDAMHLWGGGGSHCTSQCPRSVSTEGHLTPGAHTVPNGPSVQSALRNTSHSGLKPSPTAPQPSQHWGGAHTRGSQSLTAPQSSQRWGGAHTTPEGGCSRELDCALGRIKPCRLLSFCFTCTYSIREGFYICFPWEGTGFVPLSRQLHLHLLLRDPSQSGQACGVLPATSPPHRFWWPSQASSALTFSRRAFLRSLRRAAWCRARSSSPLRHCSTMAKLKRQKVLEPP